MAELNFFKIVLVLTFATTNVHAGLKLYTEHHLEAANICHPLGKKRETFVLPNDHNAAVIVRPDHMFNRWHVLTDTVCKFLFKVRKGDHLFAVIQNMSLRRNGTHCLDYIKFKRKDKQETREFCGQIDRRKVESGPMREEDSKWDKETEMPFQRDYAEFDVEGEIETTIFISKLSLQLGESLDLTIVYTPYKDCQRIEVDREEYRSIGNYNVCIWKRYFCDGYQNCLDEICQDEGDCEISTEIVGNGTGTKVTIGAVTTMLLCFVIFLMGLWICRKNKRMCWSSDCAGPSINENRLSRNERETATSTNHQSVAVDPMLEVAVLPSVVNKDLPPSYDSLFPEQSNPSTT